MVVVKEDGREKGVQDDLKYSVETSLGFGT